MNSEILEFSPETTGRILVTLRDAESARDQFASAYGSAAAVLNERLGPAALADLLVSGQPFEIAQTGVFVLTPGRDAAALSAVDLLSANELADTEPERVHYASAPHSLEFVRGARAALDLVLREAGSDEPEASWRVPGSAGRFGDTAEATWGVLATGASSSPLTGAGVRIAILDTGIDTSHPAFVGRIEATASFIPNETVDDGHGHGTHCAGTAAGRAPTGRRFGVAPDARILAGKVLSNSGSGATAGVLAGMDWAINHGAHVISLSLGSRTQVGMPHSPAYERLAALALSRGCLVVAAAGNDSDRRWLQYRPVSDPANCPSILAVGAVDGALGMASFSNRGAAAVGWEVNLVAPGVGVESARPGGSTQRMNGTSMATPHVAGLAALLAEADPALRGRALWLALEGRATPLPGILPIDAGRGLARV